jgi:hypothetical protein
MIKAGRVVMAYQPMPQRASRRVSYLGRHKEYFLVDNVQLGEDGRHRTKKISRPPQAPAN